MKEMDRVIGIGEEELGGANLSRVNKEGFSEEVILELSLIQPYTESWESVPSG